jgi:hypothetical protein
MTTAAAAQRREHGHNGSHATLRVCPAQPSVQEPGPAPNLAALVQIPSTGWSKITIRIKLHKGEEPHEAHA